MGYFQLNNSDKNRFVNALKIFFGVACIAIGIYWAIHKINALESSGSLWLTILFLFAFGFYQIWSGLGKADRYIEIGNNFIRLKKTIFMPAQYIEVADIDKIKIFPLKIIFHLKKEPKVILRFGTTYVEMNEKIIDGLTKFAEQNTIDLELESEKI